MGGYVHPDAGRTAEGTLPMLYGVLDQLPVSVLVHGADDGHPLLYRNGMAEQQMRSGPLSQMLSQLDHPRLRDLARAVAAGQEPGEVELPWAGQGGEPHLWRWRMSPLTGDGGGLTGLLSVVEDLSEPVQARQQMESAVDHGLHLLLEVARLAETSPSVDAFLRRLAGRLAGLVKADRVAFHLYDAARKALVLSAAGPGAASTGTSTLPCDPTSSDLLSQVVFAGRVYRGQLDLTDLELRPYAHLADVWPEVGTDVLMVPWRAGNERLGALVAYGGSGLPEFSQEASIVLITAGHAAGLVWQRMRAEERLAERAFELEALERAKTSFLLLASHELRTPLTLLNGYLSMLADDASLLQKQPQAMTILQQALQRMNVLVDQLMEATRLTEGQVALRLREADLRALVEPAARQVAARWRRSYDLTVSLPDHAVLMTVDALRIETVVGNLLDNAFKYSEPGDAVRCELQVAGDATRLLVADEGIGMSEEEVAGLFARFGRIVNSRTSHIGGTGLGLFLSREIARLHGGDVTASSIEGAGSRFELTLPAAGAKDIANTEGDSQA
jgi:signal transduction histidine kinase